MSRMIGRASPLPRPIPRAVTPWSTLPDTFLHEGVWAIGQGPDAPDRQLFRHLLWDVVEHDRPDNPAVLEVGHGAGIEIQGLEEGGLLAHIDYTGFDFTPELVEHCASRWPDLTFEVEDVETMQRSWFADVVLCRHTLEHLADGEAALRNLWAATRNTLIVSWFIRPTWCPDDVGCVEADGFLHQTYSAPAWIELVNELGGFLYRFDIDHHLNRGSVWIITRKQQPGLAAVAHRYLESEAFLQAALQVPPDPRERESDLLDILDEAHESLGEVIPAVPRVTDLLLVLKESNDAASAAIAILETIADHVDGADDALRQAKDARERSNAALGTHDPSAERAAQAARDAQARIESALIENGRLGG